MKALLVLAALLLSPSSFAAPVNMDPSPVDHDLNCQPVKPVMELFDLHVTTLMDDNQQNNVTAMSFSTSVPFSRGGSPDVAELKQDSQDADSATFANDSLRAVMQKGALTAAIYQGSELAYNCK